jgi:ribonuclease P/MRP protein subunit RPP1
MGIVISKTKPKTKELCTTISTSPGHPTHRSCKTQSASSSNVKLHTLSSFVSTKLPSNWTTVSYTILAINHTLSGKLPTSISPPPTLPPQLAASSNKQKRPTLLTRATLYLTSPDQLSSNKLPALQNAYDLVALRPTSEKTLALACNTADVDLISLDLSARYQFHFRHKMFSSALVRGVKFEICYAAATSTLNTSSTTNTQGLPTTNLKDDTPIIPATDASMARRNLLQNSISLIRALRGRGILLSSEARTALACRAPSDVINLACVWGLGCERGVEGLSRVGRSVLGQADVRKESYRGLVRVVHVPTSLAKKRKADDAVVDSAANTTALGKRRVKDKAALGVGRDDNDNNDDGDVSLNSGLQKNAKNTKSVKKGKDLG